MWYKIVPENPMHADRQKMKGEYEHGGAVKEKTQAITHGNRSSQTNTNAIKEARISLPNESLH